MGPEYPAQSITQNVDFSNVFSGTKFTNIKMDLKARYKNYSKEVRQQMGLIIDNNIIEDNYIPILDLLAQNYMILYDATDSIQKQMNDASDDSRLKKKQNIHTFMNAQSNIIKLLSNFPSSPLSKAKIRKLNHNDDSEDPDVLKEFLD